MSATHFGARVAEECARHREECEKLKLGRKVTQGDVRIVDAESALCDMINALYSYHGSSDGIPRELQTAYIRMVKAYHRLWIVNRS